MKTGKVKLWKNKNSQQAEEKDSVYEEVKCLLKVFDIYLKKLTWDLLKICTD